MSPEVLCLVCRQKGESVRWHASRTGNIIDEAPPEVLCLVWRQKGEWVRWHALTDKRTGNVIDEAPLCTRCAAQHSTLREEWKAIA